MVYNQSPYIYRAYDGSESSSGGNTDGLAPSAFYFNHPQHTYPGGSTFVDWEGSDVNCPYVIDPTSPANCLYTEQDPTGGQICPYYNGLINFEGDYRIWFAGVDGYGSGYVCNATFSSTGTSGSP